ncbi:MAG TPA: RNA 2',3'-cyclic phosphodiesterase [Candidatus Baltobacteraceae bacterium]|jgi:2'-5' RNA ligase|nr:RNA 2',3'-cyclic phosphodiesterase [Candidatus Baltobacteraceae bacterium]
MPEIQRKRLFAAIFPPAHVVRSLQDAVAHLAKGFATRAVRWTQPEKLHLTLNFLGAIEVARIPDIESALKAACNGHWQHTVRVAGLGCFSNRSRPQVFWAGLAGDLGPLERLKKSIDTHFAAAGCRCEDRPFRPHLTIGRASELNSAGRRSVARALAEEEDRDFGDWRVASVDLMQSILSRDGAAYTTLLSVLLENPRTSEPSG